MGHLTNCAKSFANMFEIDVFNVCYQYLCAAYFLTSYRLLIYEHKALHSSAILDFRAFIQPPCLL